MARIWQFIRLTRPLFLMGGLILYLLGAMLAFSQGIPFNLPRLVMGQVLITAIQLMTHYTNEYYDQEGDRLNTNRTWFSGGSGVLPEGTITARAATLAGIIFAVLAGAALYIAGRQVPLVVLLGVLGLAAAWSYSGPPLKLVSTGFGELSASLVVAFLVPVVGYVMQSGGRLSPVIWVICLPLILIHFAMLVAFQIPDYEADRAVGKRTLAVRLGLVRTARLHNVSLFLAFCVILGLSIARWPGAQFTWLALPLAIWQAFTIRRYLSGRPPRYLWLTMGALGLFALTSGLWLAGFVLG